jgi:hypothetical protein
MTDNNREMQYEVIAKLKEVKQRMSDTKDLLAKSMMELHELNPLLSRLGQLRFDELT